MPTNIKKNQLITKLGKSKNKNDYNDEINDDKIINQNNFNKTKNLIKMVKFQIIIFFQI